MYYLPASNASPMGRLALVFWIAGVLVAVPVLSWCFVSVLALAGVLAASSGDDAGRWVWLGGWAVGNVLWVALSYLLDAWDAQRCARRSRPEGPVILRWRNRLLVSGASSRPRLIAWCCLGLGIRIVLYPALAGLCLYAAHGFASIEDGPNSVGPQPVVGLCLVVVASVLTAVTTYRVWERAHLIRHGRLSTATVTATGVRDAGGGSPSLHVDYRFEMPAGEQLVGSERLSCRLRRMPAPGDELVILYDERRGPRAL